MSWNHWLPGARTVLGYLQATVTWKAVDELEGGYRNVSLECTFLDVTR